MRTSAWWLPWRPSNASRLASIAAPRFVPPRGMMPTSIESTLSRKAPWSSVRGRGDERGEGTLAPPPRPEEEGGERRHEQEGDEARRVAPEDHGSLRSAVSPSATSTSTRASAGHTSHG